MAKVELSLGFTSRGRPIRKRPGDLTDIEDKLEEARYFLRQMKENQRESQLALAFKFNLRAFLSAARSTIFMLRRRFARAPGFKRWMGGVERDGYLKFLIKTRNVDIHVQPFHPGFDVSATARSQGELEIQITHEDGTTTKSVREVGPPVVDVDFRWFFAEFPDKHATILCDELLEKITTVLADCQSRFVKKEV